MAKHILIINAGSSSLKYALFCNNEELIREDIPLKGRSHELLIGKIREKLLRSGYIKMQTRFDAIGHRVVHGGDIIKSCLITPEVIKQIKTYAAFAPLHNPHNLEGILVSKQLFPQAKHVAIFDTAFHTTVSNEKRVYAIPKKLAEKYNIKSYGFHGQSYQYIYAQLERLKQKNKIEKINKVIVCHLGSGCSVCAIKDGKSFAISSGITTYSGMPMATRCGDIDIGIMEILHKKTNKRLEKIMQLLDNQSGFSGIAGTANMKEIIQKRKENKNAQLAIDVFCYHLKSWIAKYIGLLNGVDCIVFTAGIGENAALIREQALKEMDYAGIKIDTKKNNRNEEIISTKKSKVTVLVLPTDEEKQMFEEVRRVLN